MIYAYALAVSEQNASGFEIVTAPTCGSAGVLPAVLFTMQDFYGFDDEAVEEGLAVAGLIGIAVKKNAYVQIPCIERNAMGAQRALDAANYALLSDGVHHVKFDQIVKIMDETGRDMMDKYKETAQGGIALLYEESGEFDDNEA